MTTIKCETATLADAVNRAARIAPNKGAAFDKAQGVIIEVRPSNPSPVYIKATDLEVSYLQRVPTIEATGDDVLWRLPSTLIAGVLSNLPLGAGNEVTLSDEGSIVTITAGKKISTIRSIDPTAFPLIKPFDPNGMATVEDLAKRVSQAAWATDAANPIFSGVHIDGTSIVACDKISAVFVPCVVPVDEPITVPLRTVAPLFKNVGPMKMRATSERLELMPDADTQITSSLIAAAYPNVKAITRDDFAGSFLVDVESLASSVTSMLVLVRGERYPSMHMDLVEHSLNLHMEVPDLGRMEDTLTVDGGTDFKMKFSPGRLVEAITHGGKSTIRLHYGPDPHKPVYITDEAGYECWAMPVRVS